MFERDEFDDNRRFPSWPQLIHRMQKSLLSDPVLEPLKDAVDHFFDEESALDCAELFRNYTEGPNYWDFLQQQFGSKPDDIHHLIKLHGSIDQPGTIVLTRSDYARSRHERSEMFRYLTDQFEYASFLFVGFSLLDPNFNILFDEAHYVRGGKILSATLCKLGKTRFARHI